VDPSGALRVDISSGFSVLGTVHTDGSDSESGGDDDEDDVDLDDDEEEGTVSGGAIPIVAWLNDIESDEMYAQWPRAYRALLQPSWQLPQIRRNLFTLVVMLDMARPAGMQGLM